MTNKKKASTALGDPSEEFTLEDLRLINAAQEAGCIQTEGPLEKTWHISQDQLKQNVAVQASTKRFDLHLANCQMTLPAYTRNGRHLLLGQQSNGILASMDWQRGRLWYERSLDPAASVTSAVIHDLAWLQDDGPGGGFVAVAQSSHVYIYDGQGIEVHRLKRHLNPRHLVYLPQHMLLASVGTEGWLCYQDVSTGQLVSEQPMESGQCRSLGMDPQTGIVWTGHAGGTVTLWSPTIGSGPMVKMLAHRGPVQALALDPRGHRLVTAGCDGWIRVWDQRTYRELHRYPVPSGRPVSSLDVSQRGILAASHGPHVTIWQGGLQSKQSAPYLNHLSPGHSIGRVRFCPWEDVLGIGHSAGFSSILVPGAGEPNYDALEVNPFADRKQRRETQVRQLLDKLPADTIILPSQAPEHFGSVSRDPVETIAAEKAIIHGGAKKERKRMRGKSTALRRYLRKRANVIDQYKMDKREAERVQVIRQSDETNEMPRALDRFVRKVQ